MERKTVFVSYGHNVFDQVVFKLVDDLDKENLFDVFLDTHYLNKGDWEKQIDNAIERCKYFVFFVSSKSISVEGYCLNELARAIELKKEIIPVMLDNSYVPLSIIRLQRLMLKNAITKDGSLINSVYSEIYGKLLRILKDEEKIGLFNDGFDIANKIQEFDAYEIAIHSKEFVGRDSFFKSFEDWINNKDALPIYLLKAFPGVGKTAICSILTLRYSDYVAGIHFCAFNNKDKTDAKNIIKNLAAQLAGRSETYYNLVRDIIKKENIDQTDTKRLFELLFIEAGSKVEFDRPQVLIVDALDEAITSDGKNEIAEILVAYQNLLPSWLRIMCSTRPEESVLSYFSNFPHYAILEDNEDNVSDIKVYYDKLLSNFKFDAETLRILLKKTHGSFLYARTIVKNIKSGNLKLEEVNDFPDGIYSFYVIWFNRIFLHGQNDYEPIKKILSLSLVTSMLPTIDFLCEALNVEEATLIRQLETISSFFVIVEDQLKARHKSVVDWLHNKKECPSMYYISRKDGYNLLLKYILEKRESGTSWKKNPYVILDYQKALKYLGKTDDLKELLMDEEFQRACLKSKYFTLYESLGEYINNIHYLYLEDEDDAYDVFESTTFTKIFILHRKKMYNAGLFIKLKECGFTKFLKSSDISDDVDYDLGVIQYFYISLCFKESYEALKEFEKEHNLDELDIDNKSEYERMAMLIYRKLVLFDELIEAGEITIKDAHDAGNLFEESLANLTLSKVYCRQLDKEKCYAAAENAVALLGKKVEEEAEEGNQIGDHLFLAEDYRVYADACIWHLDLEKAKQNLNNAQSIYVLYNQHDRYYPRFLYTSLFYEIVSGGKEETIKNLIKEVESIVKETKDLYDIGQVNFFISLYYLLKSKGDKSILAKAEAPCSEAIEINKKLAVNIELLESETLYNLICEEQGVSRKYFDRYNEHSDKWIEYVESFIRKLI